MILEIITIALFGLFMTGSFIVGYKAGSRSFKVETPIKTIKEIKTTKKEQKENEIQSERIETMLANIDAYDGTGANQKDL